jgi:hypothetical protein
MHSKTTITLLVVAIIALVGSNALAAGTIAEKRQDYTTLTSHAGGPDLVVCDPEDTRGFGGVCFDVPPGASSLRLVFEDEVCQNQEFESWPEDLRDLLPVEPPEVPAPVQQLLDTVFSLWPSESPVQNCGPGGYVLYKDANDNTLNPQVHFSCVLQTHQLQLPQNTDRVVVKFWSPGHNSAAPNCHATAGSAFAFFFG